MLKFSNKEIDESLSECQTGIAAAMIATLETEQLISYTRTANADTVTSLQGSELRVYSVSKVHESLTIFVTFWMGLFLMELVIQLHPSLSF